MSKKKLHKNLGKVLGLPKNAKVTSARPVRYQLEITVDNGSHTSTRTHFLEVS
jgi:hypothetical protein